MCSSCDPQIIDIASAVEWEQACTGLANAVCCALRSRLFCRHSNGSQISQEETGQPHMLAAVLCQHQPDILKVLFILFLFDNFIFQKNKARL